jgi:hypothetical protein
MTRRGHVVLYCPSWVSCLKVNFDFPETGDEAKKGCEEDMNSVA